MMLLSTNLLLLTFTLSHHFYGWTLAVFCHFYAPLDTTVLPVLKSMSGTLSIWSLTAIQLQFFWSSLMSAYYHLLNQYQTAYWPHCSVEA